MKKPALGGFLVLLCTAVNTVVVPRTGIEPVRLAAADFKSATSTYFVTEASAIIQHYSELINTFQNAE
jgi:hypothetical protein